MQNVDAFISALGGTVAVANALGAPPSTVSSWRSSNSIPHWRMPGLLALAKEKGVKPVSGKTAA